MKRSAPEVRLSLLLSLCAACASASAATTAWRTELARGGVEGYGNTYRPGEIHPTPDGFWLIGSSSTSNWIARHARDGSRIGLQRFGGRIGYATTDSRGDAVLRHGPGDYGFVETIDECVVERGAVGAPRSVLSLDAGAPDGGGGVIEAGTIEGLDIRSTDLYRVQRDCRKTPLPDIGSVEILDLRNDPAAAAAYVLARRNGSSSVEVLRVDRERVQWRLPLALPQRTGLLELTDADAGGVGLRWSDYDRSDFRYEIARVTVDGRLAWQRLLDVATGVVAWRPAPLLAHYANQYVVRFEALDRDTGATRFVAEPALALRDLRPLPTSSVEDGWHIQGSDAGDRAVVLGIGSSGAKRVRWRAADRTYRARAELADGSLVVARPNGFYGAQWSLVAPDVTFGEGRPLADAGVSPLARSPRWLVPAPDGAALAAYHEESRAFITRVEPDGRFAWSLPLPPRDLRDPFRVVRVVAAAMDATRACVLVDNSLADTVRCFDARTGAPAFETTIDGRPEFWRVGMFPDGIHVVDIENAFVPARVESPRLRVFGPSGELRLQRELPIDPSRDRLSELGPSGELLVLSFTSVRALASDGTLRWTAASSDQNPRIARDGGALLADLVPGGPPYRTELRRIEADGRERWRRTFDDAIAAALGPDWLVRERSRVARIADADGSDRWTQARSSSNALRATAPDGSAFLDGAGWYDGDTGARIGALADLPNLAGSALHRFDGNGHLLRLAGQLDGEGSVLALERFDRDTSAGPRARLAATGFWHAPSVPGQGIALAVDARNGDVEGRWLTFAGATETRIDAQRWYRLTGRAARDGDAIALTIAAPQPTGFDGGAIAWRAVGTARWRLRDCARVELDYALADGELVRRGLLVLERLDGQLDCEARPGPESPVDVDLWTADGDPGRGLLLAQRRDGTVLAAWPTFVPAGADAGRPHWLTLQGSRDALRVERTLAGRFAIGATRNTLTIGGATLQRIGCDRIDLDYRFDAGEVAAPFDDRAGRLVLRRRGRCPP